MYNSNPSREPARYAWRWYLYDGWEKEGKRGGARREREGDGTCYHIRFFFFPTHTFRISSFTSLSPFFFLLVFTNYLSIITP